MQEMMLEGSLPLCKVFRVADDKAEVLRTGLIEAKIGGLPSLEYASAVRDMIDSVSSSVHQSVYLAFIAGWMLGCRDVEQAHESEIEVLDIDLYPHESLEIYRIPNCRGDAHRTQVWSYHGPRSLVLVDRGF